MEGRNSGRTHSRRSHSRRSVNVFEMNERTWRCPVQKLPEGTIEAAHSAPYWGNRPSVDPGELDLDISTAGEVRYREGILEGRGQPIRKHFVLF